MTTVFKCEGVLTENKIDKQVAIFLKLEEYRPWVGLWSKSNGNVRIEKPYDLLTVWFPHLEKVSDSYHIYNIAPKKEFAGHFSTLSHRLAIRMGSSLGSFKGDCQAEKRH